jgi:hypothetical protein
MVEGSPPRLLGDYNQLIEAYNRGARISLSRLSTAHPLLRSTRETPARSAARLAGQAKP